MHSKPRTTTVKGQDSSKFDFCNLKLAIKVVGYKSV